MGDILDESFEGAGYEESNWSEEVGSGCAVDEDSTDIARPTGGGDQILQLESVSDNYARAKQTLSSGEADTWLTFYFQLYSEDMGGGAFNLVRGQSSGDADAYVLHIFDDSGTLRLLMAMYHDGTEDNMWADNNISLETWYKIDIKWDATGNTWEWRVDGVSQDSGSLTSTHVTDVQDVYFGDRWGGKTYNLYIDRVWIDSSSYGYDAGAYTLVCDAGSYAITGAAMAPYHNKKLVCDAGTITITGAAMIPLHNKKLVCDSGTLVITGAAMSPLHNKKITLDPGTYVITGKDVTLTYSGGVIIVRGSGWHMFQDMSQT